MALSFVVANGHPFPSNIDPAGTTGTSTPASSLRCWINAYTVGFGEAVDEVIQVMRFHVA